MIYRLILILTTVLQVRLISCQCDPNENKYGKDKNVDLSDEEMYKRGHLKPFGSHRPPMKVEEMKYMISPEDFYMNFVVKHIPVVFKGVTKHWPAHSLWTDGYLTEKYGDVEMNMETKDDDKLNIPPGKLFKDFLKVYKKSNLYMVDEVIPDMRKDISLPLCLRCEEIDRFFFVSYYWHSNGNTMSSIHIDTDENLLCVIKGHKRVLTVSPVYSHDLYADGARQMGVLDMNSSSIDLDKYPNVMKVPYYEAMVEEGDCVYIPQMWWHQVFSRKERQQAVALWWKSKPFWKKVKNIQSPGSAFFPEEKRKRHSYADSLIDYEYWVNNVSITLPRIECQEQRNVKMSDYTWETDKDDKAPATLGDGGDIEEEIFEANRLLTPPEIREKMEEIRRTKKPNYRGFSCDFDKENKKSPCNVKRYEEDDPRYVRYVMDYCQEFEDRGCVINKPQLLNKLLKEEFNDMAFKSKSRYEKNKS